MEEDIKILEDFIDYYGFIKTAIGDDNIRQFEINISKNEIKAIENLIARNKELKKENKELKEITTNYNAYPYYDGDDRIIIADVKYFANGFFKNNFIPKSKIKEKIEEYRSKRIKLANSTYGNFWDNPDIVNSDTALFIAGEILKELLESNMIEENENHIPYID